MRAWTKDAIPPFSYFLHRLVRDYLLDAVTFALPDSRGSTRVSEFGRDLLLVNRDSFEETSFFEVL